MQVWVFGNADLKGDSVPLKLLPELKKRFPALEFVVKDPNENWEMPKKLIVIDTIAGIKDVTIFTSLGDFVRTPRVTMHDFDLGMKLAWLAKLKKLPPFVIIGVPAEVSENIVEKIFSTLTANLP